MVQTVHWDNEFDVKEISHGGKNRYDRNVEYGRYMSSEEFRKRAIEKVNKFCDKHGIL